MYNNRVDKNYYKIFVFSLCFMSKIKVRSGIYKGIIISLLHNEINLFILRIFIKYRIKKETK